jgi:hypothetical protein
MFVTSGGGREGGRVSHLLASLQKLLLKQAGLWIRIRIGSGFRPFVDPDPGARKLRNFRGKNALFSYFFFKFYH